MIRSTIRFSLAALAVIAVAVLPLAAQESKVYRQGNSWVEETSGSLPAAHSLRANLTMGSAHISGTSQSNITFMIRLMVRTGSEEDARREFAKIRVVARGGDPAYIATESSSGHIHNMSLIAEITVPREIGSVSTESGGGDVAISNISGQVIAKTGGGSLSLDTIGGTATASTGGGSIRIANVHNVKVSTGGGSIDIQSADGAVMAETGGGGVHIANASQKVVITTGGGAISAGRCPTLEAETGGGGIDIGEVDGPATIETGGGSIRLGAAHGPVKATTGGGSIQLWKLSSGAMAETGAGTITAQFIAQRGSFSSSSLESGAGDIVVYLPADLPVTVQAHIEAAMGHTIVSEFPALQISTEGGPYGPQEITAYGNLNGGGPTLRLETNLGSIQIRKSQ